MYDAIIIGARCAGSPTAMLLARKGYKVLLLDKASFPSDTISTHIIFPNGLERLKKWGLLEKVLATGVPEVNKMGFNPGPFEIRGYPPASPDLPHIIAPRRIRLDKILVDAAVEAGAELRENCMVEEIIFENEMVTGVRCQVKNGKSTIEKAKVVIGADGKNSILARAVKPEEYNVRASLTCWYYTYWSGINTKDLTLYARPNRAFGTIPTNEGMTCIPVAAPAAEFHEIRADIEGNYWKALALEPAFEAIVRQGKQEERFFGMSDLRNYFRKPFGPGWILAGDAGYHRDPITGQGISDAFYAADTISAALDKSFTGKTNMTEALSGYEQSRNERSMPMYDLTCEWASLQPPPPEMEALLGALINNETESDNFFGTLAGTVSIPEFYSPANLQRIIGVPVS